MSAEEFITKETSSILQTGDDDIYGGGAYANADGITADRRKNPASFCTIKS